MRTYVVDSDVLATIQRANRAAAVAALGSLPVVVTDIVWDELTVGVAGKQAKATRDEMSRLLKAIALHPTVLEEESEIALTFARLRAAPVVEDVGEHSVIAYAFHEPDAIAVLLDRKALHRAVEELKGRVLSVHGFLDVLRTQHGLAAREAEAISATLLKRQVHLREPLWWT